ncbi:MAG TPA: L-glutamate gamma-semialdehyde dehydrogenase, partial [Candidatus Acidoferrum sp.]|nr:L-glutamate gamma-semialdehyde dehydrogenase [Candidatus Acidoferrum sp.]
MNAIAAVPPSRNEPVFEYRPGSPERARLEAELGRMAGEEIEIPCIIGGQRVTTGRLKKVAMPHAHGHVLARFHAAGPAEVERAAAAAQVAWPEWQAQRWEARAAVLLRAAELIAGPRRMTLNAATMLGQSKTCHQAEIDAACELVDFLRFNVGFAARLYAEQPESAPGVWNQIELRALEGFVLALTPFNFTAIAGNLPTSPALMGNVVLWKPAETQMLGAYYIYTVLEEAGLPPGVINFLPGSGAELVPLALDRPDFAGLHFTGSTDVFRDIWRRTGENLARYRNYPRLVGETGGKDFILAHPSAADDGDALVTAIVRGGYEYQGQKCSAASRVYLPESVWRQAKAPLCDTIASLRMGDVRDFRNFLGAVIKQSAFDKHAAAIAEARSAARARVLVGGETDGKTGWFVRPTLIQADDPEFRTMREELFGPIVTLHVYPDARWKETLALVDRTSPYALTGAVFARERGAIEEALAALRHAAGNFYINDKPTGAVVGQQPFGGAAP